LAKVGRPPLLTDCDPLKRPASPSRAEPSAMETSELLRVYQQTVDTDLVGPRWGARPSWNLAEWVLTMTRPPKTIQNAQPAQPSHPRPKPSATFASPSMKKLGTRTWSGLAEDLCPLETWPKWSLIVIRYRDQPAPPGQSHRLQKISVASLFLSLCLSNKNRNRNAIEI
jgi:hypothetical protein